MYDIDEALNELNQSSSYFESYKMLMLTEDEENSYGYESASNNLVTTMGKGIASGLGWVFGLGGNTGTSIWSWLGGTGRRGYSDSEKVDFGNRYNQIMEIKDQKERDTALKALTDSFTTIKGNSLPESQVTSVLEKLGSAVKGAGDDAEKALAAVKGISASELGQTANGLGGHIQAGLNKIQETFSGPNGAKNLQTLGYYGLAAGGMLGAYYLIKKFMNRKDKKQKPTPEEIATAQRLDSMDPNLVRQKFGNQSLA